MTKAYTEKQQIFLNVLFDNNINGDIRSAMKVAGYSDNTSITEVTKPLQDEILERTKLYLATRTPQAAISIVNTMLNPEVFGSNDITLKAAKEVLDRAGLVKKEEVQKTITFNPIVELPPKKKNPMLEGEIIDDEIRITEINT